MSGQNGKTKTHLENVQEKEFRADFLKELDPQGTSSHHQVPWTYYQFLTMEEAAALSAIRNLGIQTGNLRKCKVGVHIRRIDGEEGMWFWCSVNRLCNKFRISSNTEKRIVKSLVAKGFISKKTISLKRKRYIRVNMEKIEAAVDQIRLKRF